VIFLETKSDFVRSLLKNISIAGRVAQVVAHLPSKHYTLSSNPQYGRKEGRNEGRKERRKKGRKEGRKEGMKEGRKEGRERNRKERKEAREKRKRKFHGFPLHLGTNNNVQLHTYDQQGPMLSGSCPSSSSSIVIPTTGLSRKSFSFPLPGMSLQLLQCRVL
jgi:hypothetical protein